MANKITVTRGVAFRWCFAQRGRWIVYAALLVTLCGCGTTAPLNTPSAMGEDDGEACQTSENLLLDPDFTNEPSSGQAWRMVQHSGEKSFEVTVDNKVLQIERIAKEPWMLYRATVKSAAISGHTVRYSAELQADAPGVPQLHGFDHLAGLYLSVGRERARLAEHTPNVGQWSWQTFSIEQEVPAGVNTVKAGFVHQAGGTMWARNPSLVIVDCD